MSEKPVVYVFYGDDEKALQQAVTSLHTQLGDPVTADMNTTRLDGATYSPDEFLNAAATMPFLTERRLVIIANPLARLREKNLQKQFCDMLEKLPNTTAVVLVVPDQKKYKEGDWVWDTLTEKHWLHDWCAKNKPRAYLKAFALPGSGEMPGWIRDQAEKMGGKFEREAAQELASLVESNTRVALQEIDKLLTYVNYARPVTVSDVRDLTAYKAEASVFELVDAMAERNPRKSLQLLHHLLEEQDEQSIFRMVVRQFRLLVQARALLDEGQNLSGIRSALRVQDFVAKKLQNQARLFTLPRLKNLYRQLLDIEIASRSTDTSLSLALDLFITWLG